MSLPSSICLRVTTWWSRRIDYASAGAGDLEVSFAAPGSACLGAPAIGGTGSFSGTTSGTNRLVASNGDGRGPESIYRIDLAAETRVVADLIPLYAGAMLYFETECGVSATTDYRPSDPTHLDRRLSAGTQYLVVDGRIAGQAGDYVLNVTYLP